MKTVVVSAKNGRLIVNEFENEEEALSQMPQIKRWERDGQTWKDKVRYHSKSALKYWSNRKLSDVIHGTRIVHKNGKKYYEYS